VGLCLLYFLLEHLANHLNGNLTKAFETVVQFKAMMALKQESYYATLIRMMMQDLRLKRPKILRDFDFARSKTLSSMEKIKLSIIMDTELSD
jgi:hypothetical protein